MKLPPLLEPIFQQWRIKQIWPDLPKGGVLVDLGCDEPPELINRAEKRFDQIIGIDTAVKPYQKGKVTVKQQILGHKINLPAQTADVVTMLAVLEHLTYPKTIIQEIFRILKPGGKVLITVPSRYNRPLLTLLAGLGLVRPEMIKQHQHYFTPIRLKQMLIQAGFKQIEVKYFEWGLNIKVKAIREADERS
ncbi:hypothetical protein A2W24_00810 [Microgenomates group bacterium RBG_16_45_19]|nr:MAG: hypothetical protein A2W24_00810 [Microgenomates group bacterium RBG_16_45_19]